MSLPGPTRRIQVEPVPVTTPAKPERVDEPMPEPKREPAKEPVEEPEKVPA